MRYRVASRRKDRPIVAIGLFFLFLGLSVLMTSCQTKAKINNVMVALVTVKKIVISLLPQGMREESLNGRELSSGYFNTHNWEEDATDKPERAYAKVTILDAGRPYRIDVHVIKERKVRANTYVRSGEDKKATRDLVEKIKEALADRRDDRNVIDQFRAF